MNSSKTIFVTGATGNQGGAVAKHLLKNGFKVKILTRNPNSVKAQNFKRADAEIIQGDFNKPQTFSNHLDNVDGVFSVQTFQNGIAKEIRQGKDLADLAKEKNIKHFVYSSVTGADLHTGIPHWESKYEIENHIKSIGLAYTIIRPASLLENFLIPQVKSRLLKGKLVMPVDKTVVQQFIASEDIGKRVVRIFADPDKYKHQTMTLAAEEMDLIKAAQIFSDVLGKEIKNEKLPMFITRLVMGRDLYKMFTWLNKNCDELIKQFSIASNQHSDYMTLREWVTANFKSS